MSDAAATRGWGFDPSDPLQGASKCPHCNGVTLVARDSELRFVCGICGGPRVKLREDRTSGKELALSGRENAPLREANAIRKRRAGWRFAAAASGAFGSMLMLGGLVGFLFMQFSLFAAGTSVALAVPFVVLLLWMLSKAGKQSEVLKRQVEEAWKVSAREVAVAAQGITAKQLREIMPLDHQQAEQVLAELEVEDELRSRLTDDGRLLFVPTGENQLRFETAAAGSGAAGSGSAGSGSAATGSAGSALQSAAADPLEAKFQQLEQQQLQEDEALAEAEAASAAVQRQRQLQD